MRLNNDSVWRLAMKEINMKKKPMIQTERLILRSFKDQDLKDTLEILCNDEIKETYMIQDFKSKDEGIQMFERLKQMSESEDRFVYAIYLNEKLIGFINEVEIKDNTIEVGYVIHPNWKNHGYATEVLQASIKELERMGYKIRVGVFEENIASRKVIEKCGLKPIENTEEIEYRGKIHHCVYYETR